MKLETHKERRTAKEESPWNCQGEGGWGGWGGVELKLVLVTQNLTLNSDAAPNYNICLVCIGVLYFICETPQWNTYNENQCDETKQRARWWSEARRQENLQTEPWWAGPKTLIVSCQPSETDCGRSHLLISGPTHHCVIREKRSY